MKKAIIFDLDGTLLDTIYDIHQAVNVGLKSFGYPTVSVDHVRQSIGSGAMQMIKRCAPKASENHVKSIHDTYQTYYDANHKELTVIYDGILNLIQRLKSSYQLGIISNKYHHLVQSLSEYYFNDKFDIVLGMTSERPIKPAPDMLLHVCNFMNVSKEEIIYIGDSEPDIIVAKTLNVNHIAVSYGYRTKEQLLQLNPMHLVNDVEALEKVLLSIL